MKRDIVVFGLIVLILISGVTVLTGSAIAQSDNETIDNLNENDDDYNHHFTTDVRIVNDSVDDDGLYEVTFESDKRTRIVFTEITDSDASHVNLRESEHFIDEGRTTLTFDTGGTDRLTIRADGQLTRIDKTEDESTFPISLTRSYTAGETIIIAGGGGIVGVGVMVGIVFKRKIDRVTNIEWLV